MRLFRTHYAEVFRESTRRLPGTREALVRLHTRGIAMSVASNKPARFGEPILRDLDLERVLVCSEGPDRAGTTKPEPTMLRRCLDAMGVTAAAGLYVGDMALDVETAARAGVPVVLVPGGSAGLEELLATGEKVVRDLGELAGLLGA